jgi:Uma2 family endonuclease
MATVLDFRHRSLAEFLAWEEEQPERYERLGGVVRMMTGGTVAHNRITRNCARAIDARLGKSGCEVFTSDLKIVTPARDVMYPDVVVVCGAVADKATFVEAPVMVAEVLSDSTAERDHGRKRWAYQTIPALQHYVLIDQDEPAVEVASRAADGSWRSVVHRGLEGCIQLPALGFEIGLDELFAGMTFERPASEEA